MAAAAVSHPDATGAAGVSTILFIAAILRTTRRSND
jgi:hypothetical protein